MCVLLGEICGEVWSVQWMLWCQVLVNFDQLEARRSCSSDDVSARTSLVFTSLR